MYAIRSYYALADEQAVHERGSGGAGADAVGEVLRGFLCEVGVGDAVFGLAQIAGVAGEVAVDRNNFV